ncbi:MAG: phosphatase PAP2 family protein [Ignavibacteriaceae bacterium]
MKLKLSVFLILFYFINIYSQDSLSPGKTVLQKFQEDAVIFGEDAAAFFTAPLHFSDKEWFYAAGIAGGSFLSMAADNTIRRNISRKTILSLNKDFWDVPTTYGVTAYANALSLTTYAVGLFSGNDELRVTGRLMFESLSLSGISVIALRFVFGRIRPYYEEGPWSFYWFETSNEIQSFPSGHVVVAFGLSTVLAERIDNIWAKIGFYGIASLTAFSRVYNNQHWFSDVAVASLLGIGSGLFVLNREEKRMNPDKDTGIGFSISPSINGINLKVEF